MNSETARREESKQPGQVIYIEDDQMCYDQESGYYYQPQPHDPQLQILPRPRFIIKNTLGSQIQATTQYINIENLNKQQIRQLTATMEMQILDIPSDEDIQNQSHIQETDYNISGREKQCLISQDSNQVLFPKHATDETFTCQACYFEINETRAFDCQTCLAANSNLKICNFCMLGYLKETVTKYLQADEISFKCPLKTCGEIKNFDHILNRLLAIQSYNAENKGSCHSQ